MSDDEEHHAPEREVPFIAEVDKDVLDGFGNGSMLDILKTIDGNQGLSSILVSARLEESPPIAINVHQFLNVSPETGAGAGNELFQMGGAENVHSEIGKIVLENIVSGKFHRNVVPFVSSVPGVPSFNLNFEKERAKCLGKKILFRDPEFPADNSVLPKSQRQIDWLRPGKIHEKPRFIASGHSRFDVVQGALGDCWLLAATSLLTLYDELFYRVVPPDQSFTKNYTGIFHFQFWRYGQWTDVVIDDRLPTYKGKLIYMRSKSGYEFWSALLEKAYAKLYGSYKALVGGHTAGALEDFTGGLIENYHIKKNSKEQLLAILVRGFQMDSLFGCSISGDPKCREKELQNGLICGHAYSITALQKVHGRKGRTLLLRIRNPWGNDKKWKGAWSDNSSEWKYVSKEERNRIKINVKPNGEFWISFEDFYSNFDELENCHLGPECLNEICKMVGKSVFREATTWKNYPFHGKWSKKEGSAGGCITYLNTTFANNPQYIVNLKADRVENDGKSTVIFAVLQKYRRELRIHGYKNHNIGFVVYKLEPGIYGRQNQSFFKHNKIIAQTKTFASTREVTSRLRLPPGKYLIVPSTYKPNEEAEFLLRVFCTGEIKSPQA